MQHQANYKQENYEINHSVTTTDSETIENRVAVPETSCNESFDNHNVLSNDQSAINEVEGKGNKKEQPEQSTDYLQNVESSSEPTSTNADSQLQQDNQCSSGADTVYNTQTIYINKDDLVDSSVAANIEFIVETSGTVTVSNSEEFSELNSVESSQKNHDGEQQFDELPESSKEDQEPVQIKPDTTNNDGYTEEDDSLELNLSAQSQEGHNRVIQDIFNDWNDGEEDLHSQQLQQQQDAVEIELQSLLDDCSSSSAKNTSEEKRQSTDKNDGKLSNRSSRGTSKGEFCII